jgi:hypothetical protein
MMFVMFDILMNRFLHDLLHRAMYQNQHCNSIINNWTKSIKKRSTFFKKILFWIKKIYNVVDIRNFFLVERYRYASIYSRFFFLMWKIWKSERQKLEEKLDRIFSVFIRLRDCDHKWIVHCPLCSRQWHRRDAQNMHFRKRTFKKYKFSEINCHAWCEHCNVMLNWNEWAYAIRMIENYWIEITKELKFDKSTYKIHTYEFQEMIDHYLKRIKELAEEKNQTEFLPDYIKKFIS